MTTILIKKKDTAGAPAPGDLTNAAGGAEIAVNTATKRLYTKDSGGTVVELGTNPSALTTNLLFSPDATYDIGASGATRPRNLFLSGAATLGTALATGSGGTGLASYTAGDLSYYASGTALTKLAIGTAGQFLTSTGTAPQWSTLSGVAVTTFSAGTTGFTPNTATSGAITLAGTLATTNGGTGLTSFTSGGVVYASSSSALATGSAFNFNGTNLGLGVTPSAWAGYTAFQVNAASIASAGTECELSANCYYNGGWKYYATNGIGVSNYEQYNGIHLWRSAASGTAGNAVTFTDSMTLTAAGLLSIGTTNASGARIRGLGASNANAYYYLDANGPFGGSSSYSSILGFALYTDSGTRHNSQAEIQCISDSNYSGSLAFFTQNPGTYPNPIAERMRVGSNGNVQIGTTTVNNALTDVLTIAKNSTSNDVGLIIRQFGNGTAANMQLIAANDTGAAYNFISSTTSGGTQHWRLGGVGGFTSGLAFSTASAERMRLDGTNGLQVGTTAGNCGANGIHVTGVIQQGASGLSQAQIVISGGNSIQAQTLGVGYENLRLNPLGSSVLVGTTTSSVATVQGIVLDPSSGFLANNSTTSGGISLILLYSSFSTADQTKFEVTSEGDVKSRTNSYAGFSDARLKQGITPANTQWDDIKNIEVVKFQMKSEQFSDAENPWMLGVIAQQVEQVSPGLVDEDAKDGMKTVKYSILYMKAVKALQEAMTRIEQLEARLDAANL